MARFTVDLNRVNHSIAQDGKEYNLRLTQRSQAIFSTLLGLLPSIYVSAVEGPNYTVELKAVAVELARIELALEDVDSDRAIDTTRPEFLYSIIGYLLFLNGKTPSLEWNDEDYRKFLISLIRVYFQGSIPKSMSDAVALFLDGTFEVRENFLLVRNGATGLDISDQFGFQIDVICPGVFPAHMFENDAAIRIILDMVRPAHTLYRLRYVFSDKYAPNDPYGRVLDAYRWRMADYHYEDLRSYWRGIRDVDRLGRKVNRRVTGEDHSDDF